MTRDAAKVQRVMVPEVYGWRGGGGKGGGFVEVCVGSRTAGVNVSVHARAVEASSTRLSACLALSPTHLVQFLHAERAGDVLLVGKHQQRGAVQPLLLEQV